MKLHLQHLLFSNRNLKLVALLFGFGAWYMYNQTTSTVITRTVPVCLYNSTPQIETIPEQVTITLKAKRSDLQYCDLDALAVHINGARLKPGTNKIGITEQALFLPEGIKMVYCNPQPIEVKL